jgi:hypothetical protein
LTYVTVRYPHEDEDENLDEDEELEEDELDEDEELEEDWDDDEDDEGILLSAEDPGYSIRVPGVDPSVEGIAPTQAERMQSGMQDSLDLAQWKMPSIRDYFWYLVVYTFTIALAVQVIWWYQQLWAYVLWGGYLVTLVVLVALIVRSLNYRRGTYSKNFNMSTLDLQQTVETALDNVGIRIDRVERPRGVFLRPMIAVYILERTDFTINVEGRSHLRRKVVRVGRFGDDESLEKGIRFCHALDDEVDVFSQGRASRKLFHEDAC